MVGIKNSYGAYYFLLFLLIAFLAACSQDSVQEESKGNEITGEAAATEILRACKYQSGEFCEETCCQAEEKCEDGSLAFMECNLKAGEWIEKTYADSECDSECEIAKLAEVNEEVAEENKSKKSCLEGWKCLNKFERIYRNSDCSFGETERCSTSCVNDTCAYLCSPGAFSCKKDVLRKCDEDGNDWIYFTTCDYGCENGMCLNSTAQLNQTSYGSVQIIDGDTIKLDSGETVRLIGINAPEKGQPYYIESSNRLKELLNNKKIVLEIDVDDKDQYGRLLRYILIDNENINIRLIKEGYATVYIVEPNKKYKTELENAWDECMNNKINLCKPPESTPNVCDNSCIEVFELHYKAGDDCKNLNGEYVIFQNNCEFSCDLKDWTVKDESSRTPYSFPSLTLNKNDKATLYTGCGDNTNSNFYWCSKGYSCNAIWNNDKDTLYLRNSNNELVLTCSYTSKLPPCQ